MVGAARPPTAQARRRRRRGVPRAAVTRLEHRLAQLADTVPYGSLARKATEQPQAARGTKAGYSLWMMPP